MSFRNRLTVFFIGIVIVPMIAIGFVVFRLIGQSEQAKTDARVTGLASAASNLYQSQSRLAQADAQALVSDVDVAAALNPAARAALSRRLAAVASRAGLDRVLITNDGRVFVSVGSTSAIAPGSAQVVVPHGPAPRVTVSRLNASDYTAYLQGPGIQILVRNGRYTLASTFRSPPSTRLHGRGTITIRGIQYRFLTQTFHGFGNAKIAVTVLADLRATASSVRASQALAAVFIAGFILLAFAFSVLASRQLQGQVGSFLQAARRLGSGDFSAQVPIEGSDEFAALGIEFNSMSKQLEHRLDDLREAVRRIGQTFASNLDREALLELALKTAVDGVQAQAGRLTARASAHERLSEAVSVGSMYGIEEAVLAAERAALASLILGEKSEGDWHIASVALGRIEDNGPTHGLITVCRQGKPFTNDDRDVLRSLAGQTRLALENVLLHEQVQRQAVTDELTGLVNHRRFQELLGAEMEQVRRYHHPVGLIMLDVDNFKSVNDTYGHPQGDVVLRHVARMVRENSRDADTPARYGGEEMALVLPHTGLEGAQAIAERVRQGIEELRIPRLDHQGALRVTASLGVAAVTGGDKAALIAAADRALYTAKHQGKNRTVCAPSEAANVMASE
jgi:diguanylate cyclase (GGDEF)-like protein